MTAGRASLPQRFAIVLWLIVLGVGAGQTEPVHVSIKGADPDPGTRDKPVATVRKALQLVWDRDEPSEIVIHRGVYPGDVRVGNNNDRLGGPRPHLLIRAAKDPKTGQFEEAIFDGGRRIEEAEAVPGMPGVYKAPGKFSLYRGPHMWETDTRKRYTLVADLAAVKTFPASFTFTKSEVFFHTSDARPPQDHKIGMTRGINGITLWRPNVTVRGLQLRNFLDWRWSCGVEFRGANTVAEDCRVSNCFRGYQIMMEPEGVRIIRCRADDVAGGVYSQGKRPIIEDNRLYKVRDDFMVPSYPQDDCAIQFYSPASEGEVRRNLCIGFGAGIFVKCRTSEFVVEHNTTLDGLQHGIGCTSWDPKSIFRYNVLTGFVISILGADRVHSTNIVDYNCFWDPRSPESLKKCLDQVRRVGTGTHNIYADPRFAAPATGDYRLLPDSPCATMGADGKVCGAFPVASEGFKDVQSPIVALSVGAPAKPAGGSGKLYFERDPWIGGGRNLVRQLPTEGRGDEWVTPQREVTLVVYAGDHVSRPAKMKVRIGKSAWGGPEPYVHRRGVTLSEDSRTERIAVQVADLAGNWSPEKAVLVRVSDTGPKLKSEPTLYANTNGVIISFETDIPCFARVEFGEDEDYGSAHKQPDDVQRRWLSNDGGDWVEIRSNPRVTNKLVLLPPLVESGKRYHYRLDLRDEVGNRTLTPGAPFTVSGPPRVLHVSPTGRDRDGVTSSRQPWRTLQFAADRALPGDRILLAPGLYPGQCVLSHGGIEGAPITIEAKETGAAVLDARKRSKACLMLINSPHVVVKGVEARWFNRAGIYVADSPHVTVQHCRVWNNFWMGWPKGSGVFVHRSPGFVADHNLIFEIEEGIYLLQSPNSRITHNTILKNMYGAVKFTFSAAGSVSRNNSFAFSGNDQYVIHTMKDDEMDTFDSDYNNLGTRLRNPDPDDEIEVKTQVLRVGSKAVIGCNGKRYNSLEAWQEASGQDQHSIFKHPKFVDPENRDFRLQPDSPNIGAGEGGATIGALGSVSAPK